MRRRRLVVDGLDAECVKIENDKAIVNTQDADQSISEASACMASLTRTQREEVSCQEWNDYYTRRLVSPAPTTWAANRFRFPSGACFRSTVNGVTDGRQCQHGRCRRRESMLLWSLSPIDLTEQMLERISLINPHLKAYHEILVDDCRRQSRQREWWCRAQYPVAVG